MVTFGGYSQRVKVVITPEADYRYRAPVPRPLVAEKIASQIAGIDYTNFKDSVTDESRHLIYLQVWRQMFIWQGVIVETLGPTASPPVAAQAGKKPRRKRWSLFRRARRMTDTSTTDNAAGGLPESGRWGSRAKIALTRR